MTKFQTGGAKNKGVVDNLFVLRGLIDHSKYVKKELWITFHACMHADIYIYIYINFKHFMDWLQSVNRLICMN